MTHIQQQHFGGVIFEDAGMAIARQVFGPRRWRPFDPQAGANVTITSNALGVIIAATGGAATNPDDGDLVNAQRAYGRSLTRLPTIRAADGSVTVTQDALGYLLSASGGHTIEEEGAPLTQIEGASAQRVCAIAIGQCPSVDSMHNLGRHLDDEAVRPAGGGGQPAAAEPQGDKR